MPSHLSSWIVLSLLCTKVVSINPCYFPDGDIASTYVPCSSNGDGGCCLSGDFCTSLGYCVSDSKGYHYRGACTDNTWGNPSCPDYCLGDTNSGNATAVNVIACNAASTSGSWCCAYDGNCCNASTFVPTFGTIFAEPGFSSTTSPKTTTTSSSSGSVASVSATQTSSSSTSSSTLQSTTAAGTTSNSSSNTGAIVGAAVGVPLGIAALAGLFLFWRERSKRKNIEQASSENNPRTFPEFQQQDQSQNGYGQTGQGGSRGDRPLMKRYEMGSEGVIELSAGHDVVEVESPGSVPGYQQHGQDMRK